MSGINEYFTLFSKEYNLFRRYKTDESLITELDICLTKFYLITMVVMPIYIVIYKIQHYNEDVEYCNTHKNVHSCRNVTFPSCLFEIIIYFFALKLLMESLLTKITNTINFFYKNSNRVIDNVEDELNDLENTNNPDDTTQVEEIN